MKRYVKLISIFLVSIYIFSFNIIVYAGTEPKDLNENQMSQAKELYQYLISNGYSKESACGILGNADQENNCDGAGLASGASRTGAFQCSRDQANTMRKWATDNNLNPDNTLVQFTWIEANCLEHDLKSYCSMSLDDFKKMTSAEDAADAFCVAYERCTGGEGASKYSPKKYQQMDNRKRFAKAFLELFGNVKSNDKVEAIKDDGSNKEGDNTSGVQIENGVYGVKDPVTGMFTSLTETALKYPDRDELSDSELKGVSDWKSNIDYGSEDGFIKYLRIGVMLFGIIFLVWIILIYLSYWFDRINNFIEIELLPILTFGRLRVSPDESDCTFNPKNFVKGQSQTVNHRVVICICIIGIFFSILIISGVLYTILNSFVRAILGKLGVY